jgi:hypothetical protein
MPFYYSKTYTLKNTGDTLKGPDGTVLVNSPLGFLTVAYDILYFENYDSKRVTRWKFKVKIKKNTYFGKNEILVINFKFLNKLLEFFAKISI